MAYSVHRSRRCGIHQCKLHHALYTANITSAWARLSCVHGTPHPSSVSIGSSLRGRKPGSSSAVVSSMAMDPAPSAAMMAGTAHELLAPLSGAMKPK